VSLFEDHRGGRSPSLRERRDDGPYRCNRTSPEAVKLSSLLLRKLMQCRREKSYNRAHPRAALTPLTNAFVHKA